MLEQRIAPWVDGDRDLRGLRERRSADSGRCILCLLLVLHQPLQGTQLVQHALLSLQPDLALRSKTIDLLLEVSDGG